MEANRQAAEDWARKAWTKLDEADYEAAERFAEKSMALFASEDVIALLKTVRSRQQQRKELAMV